MPQSTARLLNDIILCKASETLDTTRSSHATPLVISFLTKPVGGLDSRETVPVARGVTLLQKRDPLAVGVVLLWRSAALG